MKTRRPCLFRSNGGWAYYSDRVQLRYEEGKKREPEDQRGRGGWVVGEMMTVFIRRLPVRIFMKGPLSGTRS
jgi:hypothetical protein